MSRYESDRNRDENGEAIFYPDEVEAEWDYETSAQYSTAEQQPGETNDNPYKTKPRIRTKSKSGVLSKNKLVDNADQYRRKKNPKSTEPHQKPRELNCKTKIKPCISAKPKSSLLTINRLVSIDEPDAGNGNNDSHKIKPKRKRIDKTNSLDEDDEISRILKKKPKKSADDKAEAAKKFGIQIEQFITRLEAAAEEDAQLNRKGEPAVTKLLMLREMRGVLSKQRAQEEFVARGGLSALKTWLEPMPDQCLPHVSIRSAVLNVVDGLNLDMADPSVKEQLKQSRLGHVINFLTKSEEELPNNRKLAQRLIHEWSQVIYGNSNDDAACPLSSRPPIPRTIVMNSRGIRSDLFKEDEKHLDRQKQGGDKEIKSFYGAHRPEPVAMDFKVAPPSKIQISRVITYPDPSAAQSNLENKMKKLRNNRKFQRPVKFNSSKSNP